MKKLIFLTLFLFVTPFIGAPISHLNGGPSTAFALFFSASSQASAAPVATFGFDGDPIHPEAAESEDESKKLARSIGATMSQWQFYYDATQQLQETMAQEGHDKILAHLTEILKAWSTGDLKLEKRAFDRLMTEFPESWISHYFLTVRYLKEENISAASQENEKTLELVPENLSARMMAIAIHTFRNEFAEAENGIEALLVHYPDNPDVLYLKAALYRNAHRYKEAVASLQDILVIKPHYKLLHLELINIFAQLGRWKDAQHEVDRLLKSDPGSLRFKILKANVLIGANDKERARGIYQALSDEEKNTILGRELSLELAFADKDYSKALEICELLIKERPQQISYYRSLFNIHLITKNFKSAGKTLKKLERKFPKEASRLLLRIDLHLAQGMFDEALPLLEARLEKNSFDADNYLDLAGVYREQGQYAKSVAIYKQALRYFPQSYVFHKLLGRGYRDLSLLESSADAYKQAIAIMPDQLGAHIGLATTYGAMLEHDQALAEYRKAVEIHPRNSEVHWGMAKMYLRKQNYDQAERHAQKAIEIDPAGNLGFFALAQVYEASGRVDEAIGVCEDLPYNGSRRIAREFADQGWCFASIQRFEEAKAAYQQAIEHSSHFVFAFQELARIANLTGDYITALDHVQHIFDLAPDNHGAITHQVAAYLGLGDFKKAATAYEPILNQYRDDAVLLAQAYMDFAYLFPAEENGEEYLIKKTEYIQKAFQTNPAFFEAAFYLGLAYSENPHVPELDKKDLAVVLFQKSLQIRPHIGAYIKLTSLLEALGKSEEQMQYAQQAVQHFPKDPDVNLLLAMAHATGGYYADVVTICERILETHPDFLDVYRVLGWAYQGLGENEQALQAYLKLLEKASGDADGLSRISYIYREMGDIPKAIDYGVRGVAAAPDNASLHQELGIAYATAGSFDNARQHFQKAIVLEPKSCYQNSMGYFYLTQGQYEMARQHLVEAVQYCEGFDQARAFQNLGKVYLKLDRQKEAGLAFDKAAPIYRHYGFSPGE